MKNLLFLAYYFPPDGSAGTIRTTKFARYLPEFGWNPLMLVPEPEHDVRDPTLVEEVRHVERVRVRGFQPVRLWRRLRRRTVPASEERPGGWGTGPSPAWSPPAAASGWGRSLRRRLRQVLFFPDEAVGWVPFALARGASLGAERRVRAVVATQPNSLLLGGVNLGRRLGVPALVDFRDEWARGGPSDDRPWLRRLLEAPLEAAVVRGASAVLCNTPGMEEGFRGRYPGRASRLVQLPNGYDADDFPEEAPCRTGEPATPHTGPGPLRVVYAGALYADYNPLVFLRGAARAIASGRLSAADLRLRFLGHHDAAVVKAMERTVAEGGLSGSLERPGYLPHQAAVRELVEADLILLLVPRGGSAVSRITAKTYEAMAAGRPLLALLPPGDARDLVGASGTAFEILDPLDEDGVARALLRAWEQRSRGRLQVDPHWELIRSFERRRLTGRLARLLDLLTEDPA